MDIAQQKEVDDDFKEWDELVKRRGEVKTKYPLQKLYK